MIVDELNKLIETKASIKQALIDKGQNPTDEFASYADNISNIVVGNNIFEAIGYTKTPGYLQTGINYAKEIFDSWEVGTPSSLKSRSFDRDLNLILFPAVDTANYSHISLMECSNLQYVPFINTSELRNLGHMFKGCSSLLEIEGVSDWDTGNVTAAANTFEGCSKIKNFDLSKWNLDKCNSIASMFEDCTSLESVKLPEKALLGTYGLQYTFAECSSLKVVNIPETSAKISLSGMFRGCTSLENVDLTPLINAKITDLSYVFSGAESLKQIYLPNIDLSQATTMTYMFSKCASLSELDFSEFNTEKVNNMSSIFGYCTSLQKVVNLDVSSLFGSVTLVPYPTNNVLRFLKLKNLGKNQQLTTCDFTYITYWGDESNTVEYPLTEGARQSLIDSLITDSFDRAAAGYSACRITLSSKTKPLLTEDEIAQITAKGYTIA